jgi:hypothetical protein
MNITADQDLRAMADLYAKRDLRRLGVVAAEVAGQKPQSKEAWRYVGISRLLSKAGGIPELQRAAMLGDDEAVLWLNVLSEFSFYSPGSVDPSDCIMQVELSKLRRTAYMDYPLEVHIETQAICNAKCTFCPYPTMDRQGDKMSDGLIEKIIRDLKEIPAQLPFVIAPFKVNDPFLDVRIFWVCEQINHHLPNAKLRLFTNGSPLRRKSWNVWQRYATWSICGFHLMKPRRTLTKNLWLFLSPEPLKDLTAFISASLPATRIPS